MCSRGPHEIMWWAEIGPWALSLTPLTRGRPIYRGDICHFFIYRRRPIYVFSSADLKSGTSAGSPVLLMQCNVLLLLHVKDPKQKLFEDSRTVLGDKGKA